MPEKKYTYKGKTFTESDLDKKYGAKKAEAISKFGFEPVREFEYKGKVYNYAQLQDKYGDKVEYAINKFGFKEMGVEPVKKKESGETESAELGQPSETSQSSSKPEVQEEAEQTGAPVPLSEEEVERGNQPTIDAPAVKQFDTPVEEGESTATIKPETTEEKAEARNWMVQRGLELEKERAKSIGLTPEEFRDKNAQIRANQFLPEGLQEEFKLLNNVREAQNMLKWADELPFGSEQEDKDLQAAQKAYQDFQKNRVRSIDQEIEKLKTQLANGTESHIMGITSDLEESDVAEIKERIAKLEASKKPFLSQEVKNSIVADVNEMKADNEWRTGDPEKDLENYYYSLIERRKDLIQRLEKDYGAVGTAILSNTPFLSNLTEAEMGAINQLDTKIKALSPIVLLGRNNPMEDNAWSQFYKSLGAGLFPTLAGDLQTEQTQAGNILQSAAEVDVTKFMSDEQTQALTESLETRKGEGFAGMVGTSMAMLPDFAMAAISMNAGKGLAASTKAMKALSKLEKSSKLTKYILGGVEYSLAGQMRANEMVEDEASFVAGFLGEAAVGALSSTGILGKAASSAITRVFGSKADDMIKLMSKYGSTLKKPVAGGLAEIPEEYGQEIGNILDNSDGDYNAFAEEFKQRFGTWDKNLEFATQVFFMGAMFGSGTSIGRWASNKYAEAYNNLTPEQKEKFDQAKEEISQDIENVGKVINEELSNENTETQTEDGPTEQEAETGREEQGGEISSEAPVADKGVRTKEEVLAELGEAKDAESQINLLNELQAIAEQEASEESVPESKKKTFEAGETVDLEVDESNSDNSDKNKTRQSLEEEKTVEETAPIETEKAEIERRRQEELDNRVVNDGETAPTAQDGEFKILGDNRLYRINEATGRPQVFENGFWSNTELAPNLFFHNAKRTGWQKSKDQINAKYDAELKALEEQQKLKEATGIERTPVSELSTEEKSFQNRKGLNEDKVNNIAKNWDDTQQDPVHYWVDPKTGQKIVISGHHRLAAAKKAGVGDILTREYKGTKDQAIKFAKEEANANRTMETPLERASLLREKRERGDKDTDEFLKREGNNKEQVNNYSHLNPKGKTVSMMEQMQGSGDVDTQQKVAKIADWIGRARRDGKALSDAHENEMYDFLMNPENFKRFNTKSKFTELIRALRSGKDFDASKPLGLKQLTGKGKSNSQQELDKEYEELDKEQKEAQDEINKINGRLNNPLNEDYISTNDPDYESIKRAANKKISELENRIKTIKSEKEKVRSQQKDAVRGNRDQGSLFAPPPPSTKENPQVNTTTNAKQERTDGQRPVITTYGEDIIPKSANSVPSGIEDKLTDQQKQGVNAITSAYKKGEKAFLLADGAGAGKTRQLLASGINLSKESGKETIIVTENKQIIDGSFTQDAKALGYTVTPTKDGVVIKGPSGSIKVVTYSTFRKGGYTNKGPLMLDESQNASGLDSKTGIELDRHKGFVTFSSATPFDTTNKLVYMLPRLLGISKEEFLSKIKGKIVSRKRRGMELTIEDTKPLIDLLNSLHTDLISKGKMLHRRYEFFGNENMSLDVSSKNELDTPGSDLNDALDGIDTHYRNKTKNIRLTKAEENAGVTEEEKRRQLNEQKVNEKKALLETYKANKDVVDSIKEDIANGKQVVLYGTNVSDKLTFHYATEGDSEFDQGTSEEYERPSFISQMQSLLSSAGIDFEVITGANKDKSGTVSRFQNGQTKVLIVNQTGTTGINLNDSVGNAPRKLYIAGSIPSAIQLDQLKGRVSRMNNKSKAEVVYVKNSDSDFEQERANKIAEKVAIMNSVLKGEEVTHIGETEVKTKTQKTVQPLGVSDVPLEFESISEKAFVVKGDGTYEIKDKLKEAGAKWNRKHKAWMFPKSRQEEVSTLLGQEVKFQESSSSKAVSEKLLNKVVDKLKKAFPKTKVNVLSDAEMIDKASEASGKQIQFSPYGFVYKGEVYINKDKAKLDTPIHEFGHIWTSLLKKNNPTAYKKGLDLVKGTKYERDVKRNPAYKGLSAEAKLEEALVQAIGEKGASFVTQGRKAKFRKWLNDMWAKIMDGLGLQNIDPKKLENLTFDEFTTLAAAEILSGNEIGSGKSAYENWKGENKEVSKSEIQEVKTGEPIVARVYHGTTNDFYEFDSSVKGNIEGHLGKVNYFTSDFQDASMNYQADGADITGRVEREVERIEQEFEDKPSELYQKPSDFKKYFNIEVTQKEIDNVYGDERAVAELIASKKLLGDTEQVLDLYIKLNNPVVLGNGATWFETLNVSEEDINEATEEIAKENDISIEEAKEDYYFDIQQRAIENTGYENLHIEALQDALRDNGYDSNLASEILGDSFYETEIDLNAVEQRMRKVELLFENEDGEIAGSQVIADFFKNLGFDGIILTDVASRFRNMGLSSGTSHIHVFDEFSNQIKLADGSNVTFGETSDIRFQAPNSENQLSLFGNEQTENKRKDGKTILHTSARANNPKAKSSEVQYKTGQVQYVSAERIIEENGAFSFQGKDKITSSSDVAHLFRSLQDAATENAFAVLHKKDGDYEVLYLGTGTSTGVIADSKQVAAAAVEYGADSVTFVHNHPSGNLNPSNADYQVLANMKDYVGAAGITLNAGVIINLDSGEYTEFGHKDHVTKKQPEQKGDRIVKVLSFGRQKLYEPSTDRVSITSSADVATFISKQKRGTTGAVGVIILNQRNQITKYTLHDETASVDDLKRSIIRDVGIHGERAILSVSDSVTGDKINGMNAVFSKGGSSILDIVVTGSDPSIISSYQSYADQNILREESEIKFQAPSKNPAQIAKDVLGVKTAEEYAAMFKNLPKETTLEQWYDAFPEDRPRPKKKSEPKTLGKKNRKFVERSVEDVHKEAKEKVTNMEYMPTSNPEQTKRANAWLDSVSEDEAISAIKNDDTGLDEGASFVAAQLLIKRLDADKKYAKVADLIDDLGDKSTEVARKLQTLTLWASMSPEGILNYANRQRKKAAKANPKTTAGKKSKVEKAIQTASKKSTQSDSFKETVKKFSKKVPKARVEKVLKALDSLKIDTTGKAMDATLGVPIALWNASIDIVKAAVKAGDTMAKAIERGYNHISGSHEGLDKEAYFEKFGETLKSSNKSKPIVREAEEALGIKIRDIVSKHYDDQTDAKKSLQEQIEKGTTLTPEESAAIAKIVESEFEKQAKKELEKLGKKTGTNNAVDDLIKAYNLGKAANKEVDEMVATLLGLGKFDPEVTEKILNMAKELQDTPEGFQQTEKAADLNSYIASQIGLSNSEIAWSLWYASILSGPNTQILNIYSNTINSMLELAVMGIYNIRDYQTLPAIYQGFLNGIGRGWYEAGAIMRKGYDPLKSIKFADGLKKQAQDILENEAIYKQKTLLKGKLNPLKAAKYVRRFMVAADTLFYYSNKAMRQVEYEKQIAKQSGLSGVALKKKVASLNEELQAAKVKAKEQAKKEGLTPGSRDFKRRVFEILDNAVENRSEGAEFESDKFAARATFNYEAVGVLGKMSEMISKGQQLDKVGGFVRFVFPFTRVVANVLNQQLDYTPMGIVRAANKNSSHWSNSYERQRLLIKGMMGTAFVSTIVALALDGLDDDEPFLEITGSGYGDPKKNSKLYAADWEPYTVKIGGVKVNYQYVPAGVGLLMAGKYVDSVKYGDEDDRKEAMDHIALHMSSVSDVFNMSFLSSAKTFFEALGSEQGYVRENAMKRIISNTAGSVIPNAFKQAYRYYDNTLYDNSTIQAAILRQIPYVNSTLEKKYNIFGEEIKLNRLKIASGSRESRSIELAQLLVDKDVDIPKVSNKIGDRELTVKEHNDMLIYVGKEVRKYLDENYNRLSKMDKERFEKNVRRQYTRARRRYVYKHFRD